MGLDRKMSKLDMAELFLETWVLIHWAVRVGRLLKADWKAIAQGCLLQGETPLEVGRWSKSLPMLSMIQCCSSNPGCLRTWEVCCEHSSS